MAGGIDWFRWHHGSVTDPKFQLVAKKAGVRLGDVLVVWAYILENASANADRGVIGALDFETLDFLLGMDDGTAVRIHEAMTGRGLIEGNRVARWDARQPKRERDPAPAAPDASPAKTSTERSREHRARKAAEQPDEAMQRDATPRNAMQRQETPREEERREERTPCAPNAVAFDAATGQFQIPDLLMSQWRGACPALSLDVELSKASAWLVSNPKNRKSNYARFLTNWLAKAQDRAGRVGSFAAAPTRAMFEGAI